MKISNSTNKTHVAQNKMHAVMTIEDVESASGNCGTHGFQEP